VLRHKVDLAVKRMKAAIDLASNRNIAKEVYFLNVKLTID
jgi:hypothetical protein